MTGVVAPSTKCELMSPTFINALLTRGHLNAHITLINARIPQPIRALIEAVAVTFEVLAARNAQRSIYFQLFGDALVDADTTLVNTL